MKIKVAKIVGTANVRTWAQVHEFEPEGVGDSELAQGVTEPSKFDKFGHLMAAMAFKVKKEGVEVSSFGTEIITRLQEMYYSNKSSSVMKKIEQTMESLKAEFFNEVELKIVMAVGLEINKEMILYAGRSEGEAGQVYLKRGNSLVKLLSESKEAKVVSGKLLAGDKLVAGTDQFFKLVLEGNIKSSLEQEEVNDAMEGLAAVVHGNEKNSQAAGVIARLGDIRPLKPVKALHSQGKIDKDSEDLGAFAPKKLAGGVWKMLKKQVEKLQPRAVRVRKDGGKKQKSAATVAIVLIVLLGIALVITGRKKAKTKKEMAYQAVVEEAQYKYDEALGLVELNPLRAKSLLTDSKDRIENYRIESEKELSEELSKLLSQIGEALGGVEREYEVESATEWFDFSLIKDGFKGSDWELEENSLMVFDVEKKLVVEVNLETKASKLVVGGDQISGGSLVGLAGSRGFLVSDDLVSVIDFKDEEVVAEVAAEDWGKIVDVVGFSSNLYLLDGVTKGQIYKYLGVTGGLSAQRNYLKGEDYDFSEGVSMAIDGSVWVLFSDGTIVKYVRGSKDVFVATGLDRDWQRPTKIYTSPEVDNLYVLDNQATRVVVISKTGDYQAQYVWSGMAGVSDLVVSEDLRKMFLLTGEKIFMIELKD